MKEIYPFRLFIVVMLSLLVTSCQRENLDEALVAGDQIDIPDENVIDVTGKVRISSTLSELTEEYYSYITSCAQEDFYLHTLVYAADFRLENGLVIPEGPINQIYWTTFEPMASGTFKAYGSIKDGNGIESENHYIIEIIASTPSSNSSIDIAYTGNFYLNPVYNSTAISTEFGEFNSVFEINCQFDNVEPSILTLNDGEMTEWSTGRSEFVTDGDTITYFTAMQLCNAIESQAFALEGYIHIGYGITNYNIGNTSLAIAGEYLIYFNLQGAPEVSQFIEANLFVVNEDLLMNYTSDYLQENGIPIVLSIQENEEDRLIASFVTDDSNGAVFNNLLVTINTSVVPCN